VPNTEKTEQLQIRVSPAQKRAIKQQAEKAGMSMSQWILAAAIPSQQGVFRKLVEELSSSDQRSLVFAEILEVLHAMSAEEYEMAVSEAPAAPLDSYWRNYLAATLEHAAAAKNVKAPSWTRDVAPLEEPVFGSSLESLRLHLLLHSPPAFAMRNIFIDTSVGDRV